MVFDTEANTYPAVPPLSWVFMRAYERPRASDGSAAAENRP
jgi:hypothetical protein